MQTPSCHSFTIGRRSLMLTPGCRIELDTSEKNLLAASVAAHGL
ncbi:hypothetical protein [Enterocloster citroniae]|nr:hypothetical protein [Enterocloster citroniae]